MTVSKKIKEFLEKEKIGYQTLEHDVTYSAMQTAGAQHIPGRQFVKAVIVNADGKNIMCVLPAVHKIDFDKLKQILKAKEVHLADEKEIKKLFPEYDVGAEPPFGHFANLKLYLDKILEENDEIAFNAGTHTDIIKIKLKDYLRLTKPTIADFGTHIQQRVHK